MQKYPEHSRWEIARSCERKRAFPTAAAARQRAVEDGMKATLEDVGVYKCRHCDGFHLTRGFKTPEEKWSARKL